MGNSATDNIAFVAREHHLMHAVQRLYGAALPTEIRYEVDGQLVTASAAVVAAGYPRSGSARRQRIRYDSGLTLWVNWRPETWVVEGHRLPQWGFLAVGPQTRVATELHGDRIGDYAECPEYVFADARTDPGAAARAVTPRSPGKKPPPGEADFSAHVNPPGTWIDFGGVGTDGAVKINRETRRLVIFPYPRGKEFRASLDLKTLAPAADPARVNVRAMAAGDARDLGQAKFRWEGGRLMLTFGQAGVGRLVVEW